jgi:FtsP/CotA-like multicopper oxidase with cupredoxin domain
MNSSRRGLLIAGSTAFSAGALGRRASAERSPQLNRTLPRDADPATLAPGQPGVDYHPVVTPNGAALAFRVVDNVKVFHLVAEEVDHEFARGLRAHCYGFNGRVHGPTIEALEGDRVRIYVTNRLKVPTSIHWHGVLLPNGMDGVGGLTQRPIEPDETFRYEFPLLQHGTYMYHSHHDEMTQMAMGLMGLFVIHPRYPQAPRPDREYAYLLSEWRIAVGSRRPDPNEMADFNVLTLNARTAPGTAPIVARIGDRVRLRIGNLSGMSHHPIHLHGHTFEIAATDGGAVPPAARWPEVTALVPTGSTRDFEFVADNPGDWPLHCHMTHHVMTQMGHGLPILDGVDPTLFDAALERAVPDYASMGAGMGGHGQESEDAPAMTPPNSLAMVGMRGPFGFVTMGGMFTVLKVRASLPEGRDVGWYEHPDGTVSMRADPKDLARDGIDL